MGENYGSHLPVLRLVAGLLRPKRILELGAGLYSTPFFLSLPIVRLVSIESDPEWVLQIKPNLRLSLYADYEHLSPADFDLVFIDDGKTAAERERSVRWVLGQEHPPTIVHDAEVYADVLNELAPNYAVLPTKPDTAVCW